MPLRPRCPICRSPKRNQLNALRASGMQYKEIAAAARAGGMAIKPQTVSKHFRFCLEGQMPVIDEDALVSIREAGKTAQSQVEIDFATMVQGRAVQMMRDGLLKISTKDGLQAQALLDRRAEKQADRDLARNITLLLSGAISMPPMEVIEARVVGEAPPELPDGLAPDHVVEVR